MSERTYKLIELVGVSQNSYAEATRNAIKKAAQSLRGMSWFEVTDMRGTIVDGAVGEYQVTIKVGFRVLDRQAVGGGPPRAARRASASRSRTRRR